MEPHQHYPRPLLRIQTFHIEALIAFDKEKVHVGVNVDVDLNEDTEGHENRRVFVRVEIHERHDGKEGPSNAELHVNLPRCVRLKLIVLVDRWAAIAKHGDSQGKLNYEVAQHHLQAVDHRIVIDHAHYT